MEAGFLAHNTMCLWSVKFFIFKINILTNNKTYFYLCVYHIKTFFFKKIKSTKIQKSSQHRQLTMINYVVNLFCRRLQPCDEDVYGKFDKYLMSQTSIQSFSP
jgi:hypothetical protein